jgi:hypothetical protein
MHNYIIQSILEFLNVYYIVYFSFAFISFALMAVFNFASLKKMSTAKLIVLYLVLPALHCRALLNWIDSKIRINTKI